ncbi:hypothetical protein [Treponema endosymbiont of Eucomonympha sp.]|uniref:hypothetical protein n=1 Tax=Treponema endosymbiont of Eucomonympha sp. TaxID=1580831 RepID=UPI000ABBB050|nr:hypothetical protein [Treponema endosymbiont of Eucomonympha sp.]
MALGFRLSVYRSAGNWAKATLCALRVLCGLFRRLSASLFDKLGRRLPLCRVFRALGSVRETRPLSVRSAGSALSVLRLYIALRYIAQ